MLTATAGLVDELQYVFLITLTTEECQLVFGNQISDNMVCAGGNYNEGTCRVSILRIVLIALIIHSSI